MQISHTEEFSLHSSVQGEGALLPKEKVKLSYLTHFFKVNTTLNHISSLHLCGTEQIFYQSFTSLQKGFLNHTFFWCTVGTPGHAAISFLHSTHCLSRSLWTSSPHSLYISSGRGNAGNTASCIAGRDCHPVHNSFCFFHVLHMPFPTVGKEIK